MNIRTRNPRYGWRPDLPDHRDMIYRPETVATQDVVDLEPLMPQAYDQGQLGSCTANAVAGCLQYERRLESIDPDFVPSRLFVYWCERCMEGTLPIDAGATTRDSIKAVANVGAPPEEEWPYDVSQFREQPTHSAFVAAQMDRALQYRSVQQTIGDMEACLECRHPFVIGISVYSSFESQEVAQSGVVPMPQDSDSLEGGHAMLAAGFNRTTRQFKVRNSWGAGWGQNGYCWMPYDYLGSAGLASSFWSIRLVSRLGA